MKKRTQIGLFAIIAPFAGMLIVLILFGIANILLSQAVPFDASPVEIAERTENFSQLRWMIASLLNALLGFLGVIGLMGIFAGVPIGIYYLVTDDKED